MRRHQCVELRPEHQHLVHERVATVLTNGTRLTFSIAGGADGVLYDVFANSVPAPAADTNRPWAWMGQAYHCVTKQSNDHNKPNISAFLVLGQPTDNDSDGLTTAYELLVSKTRPDRWTRTETACPMEWRSNRHEPAGR